MRFAVCFFLCFVCSSAFGQQKEVFFDVDVGDVFVAKTDKTICVMNFLWIDEATKSLIARDFEGLQQMAKEQKIKHLYKDSQLRVLSVEKNNPLHELDFAECRVIRDGKAVAKVYVFTMFFTHRTMAKN